MDENTETAILAGGCFWPAQELLRHRDGVISTRVGYTGGQNDNPTADNHPGHAEAVEVIFDPERTSYQNILEFFFQIHRPGFGEEVVGFDRSEIFYTSDEQRQVAEDVIAAASGFWGVKAVTKISEAGRFWDDVPRLQGDARGEHVLDQQRVRLACLRARGRHLPPRPPRRIKITGEQGVHTAARGREEPDAGGTGLGCEQVQRAQLAAHR
jgi:peptide-methionine (S)-S-oxide reductase